MKALQGHIDISFIDSNIIFNPFEFNDSDYNQPLYDVDSDIQYNKMYNNCD